MDPPTHLRTATVLHGSFSLPKLPANTPSYQHVIAVCAERAPAIRARRSLVNLRTHLRVLIPDSIWTGALKLATISGTRTNPFFIDHSGWHPQTTTQYLSHLRLALITLTGNTDYRFLPYPHRRLVWR